MDGLKIHVPARAVADVVRHAAQSRVRIGRMPTVAAALVLDAPTIRERVELVLAGWEMSRKHGCVFYRLRGRI